MRILYITFLLLTFFSTSFAQETVIKGQVLNAELGEPIPFSNVGIPAKKIGTATYEDGTFTLQLPAGTQKDTLLISAIGFKSKTILIADYLKKNSSKIYLSPKTYQMRSITVTSQEVETEWIGKKIAPIIGGGGYSMASDYVAYGFKIEWNKKLPIQILYSRMYLRENKNVFPLKMRCRIVGVNPKTGEPGKNLTPEYAIVSTDENKGWVTCNWPNKEVYINKSSFFILFEWLPNRKKKWAPKFSEAFFFKSKVYLKNGIMDDWEIEPSDLIYSLKVAY
ncbi:MAG TPA: carboxypeptidase-like regulatory domain-containing protein [Balneolaceae bacterium]